MSSKHALLGIKLSKKDYEDILMLSVEERMLLEKGIGHLQNVEFKKAIKILEKLVKAIPHISFMAVLLINLYIIEHKADKAIKLIKERIENTGETSELLGLLGEAYLEKGNYDKAYKWTLEAITLDAHNVRWWITLADIYAEIDTPQKAISTLEDLLLETLDENSQYLCYHRLLTYYFILIEETRKNEYLEQIMFYLKGMKKACSNDIEECYTLAIYLLQLANDSLNLELTELTKCLVEEAEELLSEEEDIGPKMETLKYSIDYQDILMNLERDPDLEQEFCIAITSHLLESEGIGELEYHRVKILSEGWLATNYYEILDQIKLLSNRYPEVYEKKKELFAELSSSKGRIKMIGTLEKEVIRMTRSENNKDINNILIILENYKQKNSKA